MPLRATWSLVCVYTYRKNTQVTVNFSNNSKYQLPPKIHSTKGTDILQLACYTRDIVGIFVMENVGDTHVFFYNNEWVG